MFMIHHIVIIIAIAAQIAAIIIALRLISGNKRNLAIILIIVAALFMLFKRGVNWYFLMQETPSQVPYKIYNFSDMIISLILFTGIYLIYLKFRNINNLAQSLYQSEERYALAAEGAQDGLWDWDVAGDRLYLSSRWMQMLGYKSAGDGYRIDSWFDLVHPDDLAGLKLALKTTGPNRRQRIEYEYRILDSHGTYRWMLCRGVVVADDIGHPVRMAGSQTDITERKLTEMRLRHDASHDMLTGLPNRQLFNNRLSRLVENALRENKFNYAVLFIDLDGFKQINDNLGHALGDQFLRETARRLITCVRPGDMLARIGGDEFVILLDNLQRRDDAAVAAERILSKLREPFTLLNRQVAVSASIGIAAGKPEWPADQLIHNADVAMYAAKTAGKSMVIDYDKVSEKRRFTVIPPTFNRNRLFNHSPLRSNRSARRFPTE
jgi:diguanylate cyclase (GGDEF)-like protein/PAS domain S-box-containing protein